MNFSGTIDPYAIDTNNVRYNKYHGKLGRLTNATISTNFSFSADNGQNKGKKNDLVGGFYDDYMDFDVPWNISISYNFTYSRPSPYRSPTISQIVNFSGDLSLTLNGNSRSNRDMILKTKKLLQPVLVSRETYIVGK